MTCKVEQENIELKEEIRLLKEKQAFHITKIYELLTEKQNGTNTNEQSPTTDPVGT